jgi:uncharacterized membrane protein
MDAKIKIAGHPVHPMLVAFPIAFYCSTLAGFIVYDATKNLFWFQVAISANITGVGTAVLAAIPGLIDWLYLPANSEAKTTGSIHMFLNVTTLLLFATNAFLVFPYWNDSAPKTILPIILSASGVVITMAAGFQGWKLVQTHHVGIDLPEADEPGAQR